MIYLSKMVIFQFATSNKQTVNDLHIDGPSENLFIFIGYQCLLSNFGSKYQLFGTIFLSRKMDHGRLLGLKIEDLPSGNLT